VSTYWWPDTCILIGVKSANSSDSIACGENAKIFPNPVLKILPAGLLMGMVIGAMILMTSGCHSSTASVEASTTQNPVVAPAGTVLRVRLHQTLETGHSRPGDRFSGTLDAPVMAGTMEILPKGTKVQGHIGTANKVLALALDCYERDGRWFALSTNIVSRTGSPPRGGMELNDVLADAAIGGADSVVLVPADSIIGFTLTSTLTA